MGAERFAPVFAFFSQEDLQADYTKWGAQRPQRMNWSSARKGASSGRKEIHMGRIGMSKELNQHPSRSRAPENGMSRRDAITLAAAGLTAPLLPAVSFAETRKETNPMSYIKVGQENSQPIEIYYEDHGSGSPVVLIHGWPLNGDAWEKQAAALLAAGHRVITYDRRGFGRSSKPAVGYNYDTFAADLNALLSALDLTGVSLVGHSMGTGEITRYIGKHGTKRLRKAVLIGTLGPYLVKAPDNPEGIDASVFSGIQAGLKADRPATLMEFLKNFYSVGGTDGKLVSARVIEANWAVAIGASPIGTVACVKAWIEDFRKDIARNDLPTMIIHGDDDRILPADVTSRRQVKLIKDVKFIEIKGGSHGLPWTHAEEINNELVKFLS
jgi:non-heme chloroperoxidase